jgi:asparaginyl-tRNA synthetase
LAEHATIEHLRDFVGREVVLKGWLYASRSSGKLIFLQIRDGSGFAQCVVFKGDVSAELFELAKHLPQETSLTVTGMVREHERQKGVFEVGVSAVDVIARPSAEYPITPKDHGIDFLMDHRHLWLRSRRQHAILRIRAEIVAAIRDYFDSHGFLLVDAPVFTPNACEGTSTLFETDFHGTPAYLTQSGQLYMEAAAAAFGKAYCFGPTFRAEKSKTRRHLAEFWMVEPEVAYMDLEGDTNLAEDFLVSVVSRVLDRRKEEFVALERDTTVLQRVQKPFPRIRYAEAIRILQEAGHATQHGEDFGGDEETVISNKFDRPVIVTHYPMSLKAFYFKRDPADPQLALNMDVLAPEGYGEIVGGGQREDDLAQLEAAIDAWLCGLPHVRETSPFPRMLTRLKP